MEEDGQIYFDEDPKPQDVARLKEAERALAEGKAEQAAEALAQAEGEEGGTQRADRPEGQDLDEEARRRALVDALEAERPRIEREYLNAEWPEG